MLRTFLSVVAAALLISVILLTPASSADTGEANISSGMHKSWSVEMDRPFTLSYEIEAVQGSSINVLVFAADNYTKYLAGEASDYLPDGSLLNVSNATMDIDLAAGTYYIVVEQASPAAGDSTTIKYQIDAKTTATPSDTLQIILGAGALIIFGLVLIIFLDIQVHKRR